MAFDLPEPSEPGALSLERTLSAGIALGDQAALAMTYLPPTKRSDDSVVGLVHVVDRAAVKTAEPQLLFAVRRVRGGYMGETPLMQSGDTSLNLTAGYHREREATAGIVWRWKF